MKRILSLITALVIVLGATSVFAATADWNGYYKVIARTNQVDTENGAAITQSYMWQKLELYPNWNLSDNVALHAGFYSQNYWGGDRGRGWGTEEPIYFSSPVNTNNYQAAATGINNSGANLGSYNAALGISAAWATLSFMGGDLTADIGRRKNLMWGEGTFLGVNFFPDRFFITYKTKALGGLLLPIMIIEKRQDKALFTAAGTKYQYIPTLVYVAPGKTVAGLTFDITTNKQSSADGVVGKRTFLYTGDLYFQHKIAMDSLNITPTFDIVYSTGVNKESATQKDKIDVLNFMLKAKIEVVKLVSVTPEIIFQKAPKEATVGNGDTYTNLFYAGVGNQYELGKIYKGNGMLATSGVGAFSYMKIPHFLTGTLKIDADVLNEIVKGLGAYAKVIYVQPIGKAKATATQAELADSDKSTVLEIDLGVSYKVDSYTKIGLDFGYAKFGKNPYFGDASNTSIMVNPALEGSNRGLYGAYSTTLGKVSAIYFGADLTINF